MSTLLISMRCTTGLSMKLGADSLGPHLVRQPCAAQLERWP
jgi:hypothetical protein